MIETRDSMISDYRRRYESAEKLKAEGNAEDAERIFFYCDGISYAFMQFFSEDINTAQYVTSAYKDDSFRPFAVNKALEQSVVEKERMES